MRAGIISSPISGTSYYGLNTKYVDFFTKLGFDVDLINPLSKKINDNIDLLVLPGGADVNPNRYGQKPEWYCGKPNIFFEEFDKEMLPLYVNRVYTGELKSIFGICRGFQSLCVHFGAKMIQDFPFRSSSYNKRWEKVERIKVNHKVHKINSIHHQGLFARHLSDAIEPIAWSLEEKNLEVMKIKDINIAGVQYHPEELIEDDFTPNFIRNLVGVEKQEKI